MLHSDHTCCSACATPRPSNMNSLKVCLMLGIKATQHSMKSCFAVQGLFALSFLVCRLIIGPALTYTVLACPTSSPVVKVWLDALPKTQPWSHSQKMTVWAPLIQVGGLGVQIISIYWAYLIGKVSCPFIATA